MKRLLTSFLILSLGALAASAVEKVDLFEAGKEGYALYRIPGIVVTKQGTVLAYCEARKSDRGDWGPIDVLMRRSTDGGKTWGPRQKIVHVEGDLPINPLAAAQNLDKPGDNTVIRAYNARQGSDDPTSPFSADVAVQAYNYRFCVTSDPAKRIPIPKPANYDRAEYVDYERKYIATPNGPYHKSHVNSPILPGFKYDGKLILTEQSRPSQIPYRSLLPREIDNLLVPVCLSATHIAWGAVRLEPVFMQTGEAAGLAAALAKQQGVAPAQLDADLLVRTLVEHRQLVRFFNDLKVTDPKPAIPAAQYFATRGLFSDYNARPDEPVTEAIQTIWREGFDQLQAGTLDPRKLAEKIHSAQLAGSPLLSHC